MDEMKIVRKGQRYAQFFRSSSFTQVWTVERVFYDAVRVPHAFLVSREEPTSTKTISCSTLVDNVQYHPVGSSGLSA
jgi:hypothetical protein